MVHVLQGELLFRKGRFEHIVGDMDAMESCRKELRLRFDEETILSLSANSSRHYFSNECREAIDLEAQEILKGREQCED